jgi:hypothetical protein
MKHACKTHRQTLFAFWFRSWDMDSMKKKPFLFTTGLQRHVTKAKPDIFLPARHHLKRHFKTL